MEKGKGKQSLLVADSKLGKPSHPLPLVAWCCNGTLLLIAHSISKKLKISVQTVSNPESLGNNDLFRGIREQLASLLDGLDPKDLAAMNLGLSHSLSRWGQSSVEPVTILTTPALSRFKLKFSPDKVDTMVIQAIALLDDLDKEINIYSMRVKVPRVPPLVYSQSSPIPQSL